MDKIKDRRFAVEKLWTIQLKTLGVILVGLIFMMGLSACGTVKSFTDPAESKNLYQDNKSSIVNVQLSPADKVEKADKQAILQKAMSLQIPFIANEGQVAKDVSFYAKIFGGTMYVTQQGEMVYSFTKVEEKSKKTDNAPTLEEIRGVTLKETLVGATAISPQSDDRAQTKVNYFIGNDKSKWRTNVSTFKSISLGEDGGCQLSAS
jgi:hypothetical protein